jgi:hypothetical protein
VSNIKTSKKNNKPVKSPYVEVHNGDLVFIENEVNYNNTSFSGKVYPLKIRDLPDRDKPREKLLESGVKSLGLAELLSVVLMTGTKKEDVLSMSSRVWKKYIFKPRP